MRLAISLLCSLMFMSLAYASDSTASADPTEVSIVNVQGGSYFFKPDRITAKVNVPIELKLSKARGMAPHNFVIEAPEAGVQVSENLGRKPKTIRVTFTRPGTYAFFCSKKSPFGKTHRMRGMEGKVIVTE